MLRYLAIAAALAMAACADDSGMYDNTPSEAIRLSRTAIAVGKGAVEERVGVVAKGEWNVTEDAAWLAATKDENTAIVAIDEYTPDPENPEVRTATLTFTSGTETKTLQVTQWPTEEVMSGRHPEYAVNQAIHEEILMPWYYDDEAQTEPADYNQTYKNFWNNYLQTLPRNSLDGGTWSIGKWRYTYSYIEKRPTGAPKDEPRLGYGMEFDLGTYDGQFAGRVLYVEEGSAAAAAGLRRGDFFHRVDGVKLDTSVVSELRDSALVYKYQYSRMIDSLVHPVEGFSPRLGMLEYNTASGRLTDKGRVVSITPERRRSTPVLHGEIIATEEVTTHEAIRAGYLVLTRFDERYETEIREAFAGFSDLTHFVLDLRYNRSGSTKMAELVGNLLVPEAAAGMTFARYEFRDAAKNRTATFEPEPASVRVDTIVVLTGPRTAGASELLINALRGIEPTIKLLVVGETTLGMSVGMVRKQYSTESHEYDTHTAAFRPFNAADEGEYGYGFVPNGGEVGEWSGAGTVWNAAWGWKQPGNIQDALLNRAMGLITGTSPIPAVGVVPASSRERPGLPREYEYPTNMVMTDE